VCTRQIGKFSILLLVLFAVALVAAAQFPQMAPMQSTNFEFDKSANFYNYKTYRWVSIPSGEQLDELTTSQLIGTLQVEFAKKNLTKANGENADLYIGYQVTTAKQKPSENEKIGGSYGSNGGASGAASATMTTVHTGLLTILMYDAAKKQLVWRGTVSNAIDADAKPDKKQDHMSRGIEKLLKNYPPPKKS
jgi:Domain of unknown function (DUF4136)